MSIIRYYQLSELPYFLALPVRTKPSVELTNQLFLLAPGFNLLTTNVPHHIETSQLICCKSIDRFLYDGQHWSFMGEVALMAFRCSFKSSEKSHRTFMLVAQMVSYFTTCRLAS